MSSTVVACPATQVLVRVTETAARILRKQHIYGAPGMHRLCYRAGGLYPKPQSSTVGSYTTKREPGLVTFANYSLLMSSYSPVKMTRRPVPILSPVQKKRRRVAAETVKETVAGVRCNIDVATFSGEM